MDTALRLTLAEYRDLRHHEFLLKVPGVDQPLVLMVKDNVADGVGHIMKSWTRADFKKKTDTTATTVNEYFERRRSGRYFCKPCKKLLKSKSHRGVGGHCRSAFHRQNVENWDSSH